MNNIKYARSNPPPRVVPQGTRLKTKTLNLSVFVFSLWLATSEFCYCKTSRVELGEIESPCRRFLPRRLHT